MDPLSALSVAAAAVQFLDYGSRILVDSWDIWKSSGQAPRNAELAEITQNLTTLMKEVDDKAQGAQRDRGVTGAEGSGPRLDEPSRAKFLSLCRECNDICTDLKERLDKLKTHGNQGIKHAADSFVVALKGVRSAPKINGLKERIHQLEKQIMMASLVILWGQAEKSEVTSLEIAQRQVATMSKLHTIDETTRKFGEELVNVVDGRSSKAEGIVKYVLDSDWKPSDAIRWQVQESRSNKAKLRHEQRTQEVINSLPFESMLHREKAIPEAYAKTFGWVFSKPRRTDDGEPLWSDFTDWLSSDSDNIYWITGKPGAGKSTLTKFIGKDERLQAHLQTWAGPSSRLILARYFSWNSGSRLQKSPQGLLRTILYECLSSDPEMLVPIVFPARWSLLQVFTERLDLPDWQPKELEAGFRALVSHAGRKASKKHPILKLALLIDGLDEFEVSQGNYQPLVDLIQEANENPSVKICVSSRPWNVFRDAFSQNPMLQLERLTRPDIELYIRDKFERSLGFRERRAMYQAAAEKLLRDIADKALGVFLWVSVAVWNLLQSLQEGDSLAKMQETLDSLPEDLSKLFQVMWEQTHPSYRTEAAHYFDVMKCFEDQNLTPFALSIGMGDNQEVGIDLDINQVVNSFLSGVVLSLNRKLNSRTKGLLEIHQMENSRESVVSYMHRTAREWVHENWGLMMATAEPGFDARLWALKGETLRLPIENYVTPNFMDMMFWSHLGILVELAREPGANIGASATSATLLVQTLDRLDREVKKLSLVKFRDGKSCLLKDTYPTQDRPPPSSASNTKQEIALVHWGNAVTPTRGWSQWGQLDFLDMMAQVPVSQYVRAKVLEHPSLTRDSGKVMPVLVHAILGGFADFPMACKLGPPPEQ
ncbi:hypothetical protein TrVGV298_006388 [Trichoderma virens]|nr:hypothetical protein TrVGV298_006388 [Trichoderma virens]